MSACSVVRPTSAAIAMYRPPKNLAYHPDSRTLEAVSVGRTRVTFTHRDQSAVLQVEVVPADPPSPESKVVIEPADGRIAVAELLGVKVYVVSPDGQDRNRCAAYQQRFPDRQHSGIGGAGNGGGAGDH